MCGSGGVVERQLCTERRQVEPADNVMRLACVGLSAIDVNSIEVYMSFVCVCREKPVMRDCELSNPTLCVCTCTCMLRVHSVIKSLKSGT